MPLVETRLLIDEAVKTSSGVCAFNIITLEHAEAVTWGAEASREPVILQISENAVRYHQDNVFALAAAATAVANAALVDVSLHLDHIEDDELLHSAADAVLEPVMQRHASSPPPTRWNTGWPAWTAVSAIQHRGRTRRSVKAALTPQASEPTRTRPADSSPLQASTRSPWPSAVPMP